MKLDPSHDTSRKVLEKLGFEYKGMKWFDETKQEDLYYELSELNQTLRVDS